MSVNVRYCVVTCCVVAYTRRECRYFASETQYILDAVVEAGGTLALDAATVFAPTFEDFVYVASTPNSPLRGFLEFASALRRNRRSRRLVQSLLDALVADVDLPKWVNTLMQAAYALYVVVRLQAVPREAQPQPYIAGAAVPAFSVRLLRRLRSLGMCWMTPEMRTSLRE